MDLDRVRREGKALRTPSLLARVSASPLARLRVGIVVPRYGHSAVDRNRLKRRLRELVRLEVLPLKLENDVVFWAQRQAYAANFAELKSVMMSIVGRLPDACRGVQ